MAHIQNSRGTMKAMSQRSPSIFRAAQKRIMASIFIQVSGMGSKWREPSP